jgi:hypothetical protein
MFPMLDKETLASVLDANEGDIDKTMEMFMPINPATKEEHQKRPASASGAAGAAPSVHIEQLMTWACSTSVDMQV